MRTSIHPSAYIQIVQLYIRLLLLLLRHCVGSTQGNFHSQTREKFHIGIPFLHVEHLFNVSIRLHGGCRHTLHNSLQNNRFKKIFPFFRKIVKNQYIGRNILIKNLDRNDVNVCRHTESFVCVDIQQPIVTNQTAGESSVYYYNTAEYIGRNYYSNWRLPC